MKIKTLSVVLTERCNLKCRYCYFKERHPKDISLADLKKAMDAFFCFGEKKPIINFTGGEPLLRFDLLKKAILYIRKVKDVSAEIGMVTNGTLLDEDKADFLRKNGVFVIVSLDGGREITDKNRIFAQGSQSVFEIVAGNLRKAGLKNPGASLVFDKETFEHLPASLTILQSLGLSHFSFHPRFDEVWSEKELKRLEKVFDELAGIFRNWKKKSKVFNIPDYENFRRGQQSGGSDCQKMMLGADGFFYPACPAFFGIPLAARKKYRLGQKKGELSERVRGQLLGEPRKRLYSRKKISDVFCPVNGYYHCLLKGREFSGARGSFEKISAVYEKLFSEISPKNAQR